MHNSKSYRAFKMLLSAEVEKSLGNKFLEEMDPSFEDMKGEDPNNFSLKINELFERIPSLFFGHFILITISR